MTSSAVLRNEGLSTLDERYDQASTSNTHGFHTVADHNSLQIQKLYQEDDSDMPDDEYDEEADDDW
jgi:hypothetical protein